MSGKQGNEKNTGIPYEKVTKTIFEKALTRDDVKNLTIEHDAHIQGDKLGEHQIDVYWRFTVAGIEHQVCVQCKDWKQNVPPGAVFTFAGVLADIPGQPRGIMIARTGFQKGAKDIAERSGIVLYTLREPETDIDWEGLIREINIEITPLIPQFGPFTIKFDEEWIAAEKARLGMQPEETINVQIDNMLDRVWTCDESGQPLQTGTEIVNSIVRTSASTEVPQPVEYVFSEPTYLYTSGEARFPYIKLHSLSSEIWHQPAPTSHIVLKADDITSYILTDVLAGSKTAINRDLEMVLAPGT